MNVTYNDEERIVITIKDRAISPVIEPALRIRVTSAGRVESVVYVLDIASSLNQSAGAIAESLGFQAWPDIPILEFRTEDVFRPSYDAAVLIAALYSPTTQAGSTAAELMPSLDIILTEAMERADRNRDFFDFEEYRSNAKRRIK
jgi:hypothetical protein